jgi:hypothetical protein
MKRAILIVAVIAAACNSNNIIVGSGQFVAPTGLAVLPAPDRDLVFVSGTGRDGLRALQVCEGTDSDGNLVRTCTEDQQFVPGPVRVFPANIETGNRPLRLAGAWLSGPPLADAGTPGAATPQGVVLVAGADNTVRMVDSQNVLDAVQTGVVSEPLSLPIDGIAADLVTDNLYDPTSDTMTLSTEPVVAFVATAATGTAPAELIEFPVALVNGAVSAPDRTAIRGCMLAGVTPARLALAPREQPPPQCTVVATDATGATAVVPGPGCTQNPPPPTDIFVADGAGDGVVRVARDSLVPLAGPGLGAATSTPLPSCTTTRVSAGGRSVRSVALSPQWYEVVVKPAVDATATTPAVAALTVTVNHPAGELLMMVLQPSETPTPGQPFDSGGVLFVDLCTYGPPDPTGDNLGHCKDFTGSAILPIPPVRYDASSPGAAGAPVQAMEPIAPGGLARDGTFVRAFIPSPFSTLPDCSSTGACTPLFVGQGNTPQAGYKLLAAVTSSDGGTYFVDVLSRRFVDSNFFNLPNNPFALEPQLIIAPALSPASASANPPLFVFAAADATHPLTGWLKAGVTHTSTWSVVWHGTFPGLEQLGGTVTPSGHGTMFFDSNGIDFTAAGADPILQFGAGDAMSFVRFSLGVSGSAACQTLVTSASLLVQSFEATIVGVNQDGAHPGRLEFAVPAPLDLNPNDACASFGAIVEFHSAGQKPWIVYDNSTAQARVANNEFFIGKEPRFDYPFDYKPATAAAPAIFPLPALPPDLSTDEAVAFTLEGGEPTIPGSQFTFSVNSFLAPLTYSDPALLNGFATSIVPFTSFNNPNANPSALFTAVTGSDSVIMATPGILNANVNGIRVFR